MCAATAARDLVERRPMHCIAAAERPPRTSSRRRTILRSSSALAVLAAAWPDAASAHGLVGKQDLPIPGWLVGWAAAGVLVVSFVGLAVLWTKPRFEPLRERRLLG